MELCVHLMKQVQGTVNMKRLFHIVVHELFDISDTVQKAASL